MKPFPRVLSRVFYALFSVVFLAVSAVMGSAVAGAQTVEDTATEIHVVDEVGALDSVGWNEDSSIQNNASGMEDYHMLALLIDGDWVEDDSYDQSVYEYVTTEMTDVDGIEDYGLEDDTIMLTISPESRHLGVYGGDDVAIDAQTVENAVSTMRDPAQNEDWVGTIERGYDSITMSLGHASADDGAGTQSGSGDQGSTQSGEADAAAALYTLLIVLGVMFALGVGFALFFFISVLLGRRRSDREERRMFAQNAEAREQFWEDTVAVIRENPAEASSVGMELSVAENELDRIRRAKDPGTPRFRRKKLIRDIYGSTAYPKYRDRKHFLIRRHRIAGWETLWQQKVSDAKAKVKEAEDSVARMKEIAKYPDGAAMEKQAYRLINKARRRLKKVDDRVQSGSSDLVWGDQEIDGILDELKSGIQKHGSNLTLSEAAKEDARMRGQSAYSGSGSSFNFYMAAMMGYTVAHSMHRSSGADSGYSDGGGYSSSSVPSSTSSSTTSFSNNIGGFGGFSGGSGGFGGGGGGFSGGSGRF